MNYFRVLLAAVAATIAFFIYGFVVHGWLIAKDYIPHPEGVYRAGDAAQTHMPFGLPGLFVAIAVFATIYAKSYRTPGARTGASLGLLFGIFMGSLRRGQLGHTQYQWKTRLRVGGKRAR